jgi:NitT/TauT family transport system permease protein
MGPIETNDEFIKLLKSFDASRWQIFKKVIIPSSLSWVIASFRLTISFALLGAFIGEYMSSNSGLGYRILKSSGLYNIPGVLGGIFLMVILAFIFRVIVSFLIKIFIPWHQEMNERH